jgi:hypothetical protein
MCGWGFVYSSLWRVAWFPCTHEYGTAEVEWYFPEDVRTEYPDGHHLELIDYHGTWSIPQVEPLAHTRLPPEAEEWDRPAHDLASFLVEVSRQVVRISGRTLEPWRALATVAENYRTFLSTYGLADDPNGRSAFRTAWWVSVQDGTIRYC